MDLHLNGKVALIAGGSSGIGLATAQQLGQEGCRLLLCGRTKATLERAKVSILANSPHCMVEVFEADIYEEEKAPLLVTQAIRCFGTIDILVNSTEGASFTPDMEVFSNQNWLEACKKKLLGYIRLMQHVFDYMKTQGSGKIINVVGLTGKEPSSNLMISGVVNAGLINFIKAFSKTAAQYNVCITGINPGFIATPRYQAFIHTLSKASGRPDEFIEKNICDEIPLKRIGQAEEVAALITFLASSLANYITGIAICIDGGLSQAV
ncbi:SDR family oxidoreductase [Fluoribacter gormanii]|uniref:SDR family oxidoreductase n=1 Tax=Fluoribacter gormanii TaxID=464 RepID=UPI00104100F3|nr:SDR family oxidoreductase [Fluoribacter gormanii]